MNWCRRILLSGLSWGAALTLAACDPAPGGDAQTGSLVWTEEFNGAGVDSASWNFEVNGDGGGNNELQYYRSQNAAIGALPDGSGTGLVITARKETFLGKAYTSSRLNTKGKREFTFGKIEARLKLPEGQGIWPAFWMLGANIDSSPWPACGEIDIMEMVGGAGTPDRTTYGTLHWGPDWQNHYQTQGSHSLTLPDKLSAGFHVYAVSWSPTWIEWSVDGQVFFGQAVAGAAMECFRKPQFLLVNLAVGGNWPGAPNASTVFPQEYWIDWIRVYQ